MHVCMYIQIITSIYSNCWCICFVTPVFNMYLISMDLLSAGLVQNSDQRT